MTKRNLISSSVLASLIAGVLGLVYGLALFLSMPAHNWEREVYDASGHLDYPHIATVIAACSGTLYVPVFVVFSVMIAACAPCVPVLSKISSRVVRLHAICMAGGVCTGAYKAIEHFNETFYQPTIRGFGVDWPGVYLMFSGWFGVGFFGSVCLVVAVIAPVFLLSRWRSGFPSRPGLR